MNNATTQDEPKKVPVKKPDDERTEITRVAICSSSEERFE